MRTSLRHQCALLDISLFAPFSHNSTNSRCQPLWEVVTELADRPTHQRGVLLSVFKQLRFCLLPSLRACLNFNLTHNNKVVSIVSLSPSACNGASGKPADNLARVDEPHLCAGFVGNYMGPRCRTKVPIQQLGYCTSCIATPLLDWPCFSSALCTFSFSIRSGLRSLHTTVVTRPLILP